MSGLRTLASGIAFGESPRWHDGRLWLCDWGAGEIVAVALDGTSEVVGRVDAFPFSIDWLPGGRLLVIANHALLRRDHGGALVAHADLRGLSAHAWNEIVVDGRGHAYVNCVGFDFPGGEFAPGTIAVVTPDGQARPVAGELAFPNGMAITPDNATLIVAESYAKRLTAFDIEADGGLADRRVWADLGDGVPDGICLDADGAVWYADVPNRRCVRVREGGEVLARLDHDRGCFACALGGADGTTLFVVAREWQGTTSASDGTRTGQVVTAQAPAPRAGYP